MPSVPAEAYEPDRIEAIEIEALVHAIHARWGYDFRGYAAASFRRRVLRAVEHEGLSTVSALQERVLRDPAVFERFIGHVSVAVTSMFRDPAFFASFREKALPILRTWPFLRIWHAGCCTGEEVYSLAILLEEAGLYDRCRIYATDLSAELLEHARKGIYPLRVMRTYTRNYQLAGGQRDFSSYYTADAHAARMDPRLRRNVVFSVHNLVSDGSFNEFHLVLCRNVLIYFDPALRDRVHGLLHDSLVRFGVLGLGSRETVAHTPHAPHYQTLDIETKLYRKTS